MRSAINLLDGKVVATERPDLLRAVEVAEGVLLPLPPASKAQPGQTVVYGIRPEHVALTSAEAGQAVSLTLVEPAGWETHLHADLKGLTLRILSVERIGAKPGDQAGILIQPDRVHLFDKATGRRL